MPLYGNEQTLLHVMQYDRKKGSQAGFIRHSVWVADDRIVFFDVWAFWLFLRCRNVWKKWVENDFALYSMNRMEIVAWNNP